MVHGRFLVLCGLVSLVLLSSCTDGRSPVEESSTGSAAVALNTVFPQGTTAEEVADITRIRVTVKRVSDDSVIGVFVTEVDPTLEVWTISLEVEIPPDNPPVYLITELISVLNGVETVEFSGVTGEFSLLGQTPVQEVEVVQGPVANNFVTSVTLQPAGPVTEGDGLQLHAQVQMSQPGAPTLLWSSADPAIATVTGAGFLQAHLPGTARISVTAGGQSDDTSVLVLARPIGLAFVSQPSSVEVGEPLDPAPSVEVFDPRGDRVSGFAGPVTLELQERPATVATNTAAPSTADAGTADAGSADASPAAAAAAASEATDSPQATDLAGTTTVDAVAGLATFPGLAIPDGGRYRLLARAQGLNPATSQDFDVRLEAADIEVSKVVDKDTALEDEEVVFTVTVVNHGPASATGVDVADPLPGGLVLVSAIPSRGIYITASGRWDVGTLENGASATLTITARIARATGGSTLVNVASAPPLREQRDDPSNNEASASVAVGRQVADIEVRKVADKVEVRETETVDFIISVSNLGPDQANNIIVSEQLPAGLELVSATPETGSFDAGRLEWRIESLGPGALARLRVTAVVTRGAAGQSLTNRAVAELQEHREDDPANNTGSATIRALPEETVPEDHAFKTAGNTRLEGEPGGEISPAPPFPAPPPPTPTVKTHSLTKNTPSLTVVSTGSQTTAEGGTVVINSDGTFLYTPPLGFTGATDSFTYTTDNGLTATVTITILEMVWYVNNTAGAGGTGQSHSPFDALWDAESASGPGDGIFIHYGDGSDTNQQLGIALQDDQHLVGEGVGLDVPGIGMIVPPGSPPLISADCDYAVRLADGSEVGGLTIVDGSYSGGIFGFGVDGGRIENVTIVGTTDNAVHLSNTTGTFDFDGLEIDGASFNGFYVLGGDATVNVNLGSGGIQDGSNYAVQVQNMTGGSVSFSGGPITSPQYPGIRLSNNSGTSTVTFNNSVTLSHPGAGPAPAQGAPASTASVGGPSGLLNIQSGGSSSSITFSDLTISSGASNYGIVIENQSGPVNISGSTVSTVGAPGVWVLNSSGANNLSFSSVSVNNSSGDGIFLQNNSGTFTFSSLDINNTNGRGLFASNTGTLNVAGSSNTISTDGSFGTRTAVEVVGTTIGGGGMTFQSLSCDTCTIGIRLDEVPGGKFVVTGTGTVGSGGLIKNTSGAGIDINNSSAVSLDGLDIQSTGGAGINLTNSSGTSTVLVTGSNIFDTPSGNGVLADASGGTLNLTLSNNTVDTDSSQDGLDISSNTLSTMCLDLDNNTVSVGDATPIRLRQLDSSAMSVVGLGSAASGGSGESAVATLLSSRNNSASAWVTINTSILAGGASCPLP